MKPTNAVYYLFILLFSLKSFARRPVPSIIYGNDSRVESKDFIDERFVDYSHSVAGLVPFYDIFEVSREQKDEDIEKNLKRLKGRVDEKTYRSLENLMNQARGINSDEENDKRKKSGLKALLNRYISRLMGSSHFEFESTKNVVNTFNACPGVRFDDQTVLMHCSGFLVDKDKIVTAGHCLDKISCEDARWVFGYYKGVHRFMKDDVYKCEKVLSIKSSKSSYHGIDYAVIKLTRSVVGRTPLRVRKSGHLGRSIPLVVIGHPLGIPMKTATGVSKNYWSREYIDTDLDTFVGNSGSPVFNRRTGVVEGILIRGHEDMKKDEGDQCLSEKKLPLYKGQEKVLRITKIPGI